MLSTEISKNISSMSPRITPARSRRRVCFSLTGGKAEAIKEFLCYEISGFFSYCVYFPLMTVVRSHF